MWNLCEECCTLDHLFCYKILCQLHTCDATILMNVIADNFHTIPSTTNKPHMSSLPCGTYDNQHQCNLKYLYNNLKHLQPTSAGAHMPKRILRVHPSRLCHGWSVQNSTVIYILICCKHLAISYNQEFNSEHKHQSIEWFRVLEYKDSI